MHKLGQGLALAAMIALVGCAAKSPVSLNASDYATTAVSQVGAPTVASFSPASGEAGTVVTITGSGFDATVPTNNTVLFNGVPGLISSATATTLTATVPVGAAYGTITVIVNGKTATSATNYSGAPRIQTIAGATLLNGVPAASVSVPINNETQDAQGNVYLASSTVVYKVTPDGTLTTFAGTGHNGYTGDGGPATSAQLSGAAGLAVDASGNVYIADATYRVVRKVDAATHVITTIAGNGRSSFSGDNGPATAAQLAGPGGGAIAIQIVNIGGGGSSALSPFSLALDATGDLFVADTNNNRIREVNATTGVITTVAGGGTTFGDGGAATSATLNRPYGVAVDATGDLFVADTNNNRIREVNATTGVITTVAGNGTGTYAGDGGTAASASIRTPYGIAVDATGNLFIADTNNNRIREVNAATDVITTVAGNGVNGYTGDGGAATSADLTYPRIVTVDPSGNLLIGDNTSNHVRKVNATTGVISTLVGGSTSWYLPGGPTASTPIVGPKGMAEDGHDNLYFSSNAGVYKLSNGVITHVVGYGGFSGDGGAAASAQVNNPLGLAVDATGDLFIADTNNIRIRKVDAVTGNISTVAGNGVLGFAGDGGAATSANLNRPQAVAVDAAGDLFIADMANNRIRKVDAGTGTISTIAGGPNAGFAGDGGPATQATLNSPTSLALDAAGNLYVLDSANYRVRRIDTHGVITTVAGNGYFSYFGLGKATHYTLLSPISMTVDPAGTVYIGDNQDCRIYRVKTDGTLTTYAGDGTYGNSGDGGPADQAQIGTPAALLWSHSGNLLMGDTSYNLIRSIGY